MSIIIDEYLGIDDKEKLNKILKILKEKKIFKFRN